MKKGSQSIVRDFVVERSEDALEQQLLTVESFPSSPLEALLENIQNRQREEERKKLEEQKERLKIAEEKRMVEFKERQKQQLEAAFFSRENEKYKQIVQSSSATDKEKQAAWAHMLKTFSVEQIGKEQTSLFYVKGAVIAPEHLSIPLNRKVNLDLNWIPPGSFLMGSAPSEEGHYRDEGPIHKVHVMELFWLGIFPITRRQWNAVMGKPTRLKPLINFANRDDMPMNNLNWFEATQFCEKLNEKLSELERVPKGFKFCLPTEKQWEYACRAGTQSRFYNGDEISNLDRIAWYNRNSSRSLQAPGLKEPNAFGLYDMLGNISEWCDDDYSAYDDKFDAVTYDDHSELKVARGGSFAVYAHGCRCAKRDDYPAKSKNDLLGFRVALSCDPVVQY